MNHSKTACLSKRTVLPLRMHGISPAFAQEYTVTALTFRSFATSLALMISEMRLGESSDSILGGVCFCLWESSFGLRVFARAFGFSLARRSSSCFAGVLLFIFHFNPPIPHKKNKRQRVARP